MADSLALATLHAASWRATYVNELPATFLATLDPVERAERWRHWLTHLPVRVLVAEDGRDIVGFSAFGPCRDRDLDPIRVMTVYNFHTAPDRWGRGIGKAMFVETRRIGERTGFRELSLWVAPTNTRARRFYEAMGLEPDGGTQVEELEPGAIFNEMRYRGPVSAADRAPGQR